MKSWIAKKNELDYEKQNKAWVGKDNKKELEHFDKI